MLFQTVDNSNIYLISNIMTTTISYKILPESIEVPEGYALFGHNTAGVKHLIKYCSFLTRKSFVRVFTLCLF